MPTHKKRPRESPAWPTTLPCADLFFTAGLPRTRSAGGFRAFSWAQGPTMLPTMLSSLSLLSVECVILSVVCTFEPDNGSDVRFAGKVNQVKHYPRPTVFTGWVQATYPTEGYVVHEGLRDRNRRGGGEEVLCAGASAGWSSRVASKQDMAAFTVKWGWWRRRGRRQHLDGKFVLRLPVK